MSRQLTRDGRPAQSHGDRTDTRLLCLAFSAKTAAPPGFIERDASAICGLFTELFAGLFVCHFLRCLGHKVFFASVSVAFGVHGTVDPCVPPCSYDEFVDIKCSVRVKAPAVVTTTHP